MSTATAPPATYQSFAAMNRFSVAQYQRMIESGVLTPDDRVELLENYVVLKMPANPPHDGTIEYIDEVIRPFVPAGWRVRVQMSIVLPDSQPEPDLAIARGDRRTYLSRHPTPGDMGVVVEVADSSLLRDQRDKTRIYARADIPVYWIINLVDRRVEVYTQPSGPTAVPAYGAFQTYRPGDSVPLVLDGVVVGSVPATDLLP